MPRIASPYALFPVMQYSYIVNAFNLPGVQLYARTATLPTVNNNPVKADHMNGYIKVKGKTEWEDVTLECYQFEGITAPGLWKYMKKHQAVRTAIDKAEDSYKRDMQILILNPLQIPIGMWRLHDAFFSSVSWGNMDWSANDINKCTITIAYDYATYFGL